MDLRVLNNASRTVDGERHLKVAKASLEKLGSRDITVDEDETVKVGGEDPETGARAGDLSVTVEQDVLEAFNQNHRQEIAQAYELEATTIVVQPGSELTLKAGGSFLKIDSSGITIKGSQVKINEGGSPGSAGVSASPAAPTAPRETEKVVSGQDVVYSPLAPIRAEAVVPPQAVWAEDQRQSGDPLSIGEAQTLFKELAKDREIPFDYPVDCCYTRAHRMCEMMKAKGVECGKHWLFDENWGEPGMSSSLEPTDSKGAPVRFPSPGGRDVSWVYHVAPTVRVRKSDGSVEEMQSPGHAQIW